MKALLVCLATLLIAQVAAADSPKPPADARMPATIPVSRVPAVGTLDPSQPFAQPVAQLDGKPVYRPLFPSLLKDPVDRALVLRDYERHRFILSEFEVSVGFERYQHAQFHGIDALRDNRLQREHATLEDYRHYVADELKINAMLFTICQSAVTWAERASQQDAYLAQLRRGAVVKPS